MFETFRFNHLTAMIPTYHLEFQLHLPPQAPITSYINQSCNYHILDLSDAQVDSYTQS
jgi:hypothetical protein